MRGFCTYGFGTVFALKGVVPAGTASRTSAAAPHVAE
jgi:hypothetical protein